MRWCLEIVCQVFLAITRKVEGFFLFACLLFLRPKWNTEKLLTGIDSSAIWERIQPHSASCRWWASWEKQESPPFSAPYSPTCQFPKPGGSRWVCCLLRFAVWLLSSENRFAWLFQVRNWIPGVPCCTEHVEMSQWKIHLLILTYFCLQRWRCACWAEAVCLPSKTSCSVLGWTH